MGLRPAYTKEQQKIHQEFRKKHVRLRKSQIDKILKQRKRKRRLIITMGLAIALASFLLAKEVKGDPISSLNDRVLTGAIKSPVTSQMIEKLTLPIVPDKPIKSGQILPNSALREKGRAIARVHNVSFEQMDRIITCESGWNPNAKNPHSSATGLVQILLSAHLDITEEQALDPIFSLEYLASNLESGHASMWVCK